MSEPYKTKWSLDNVTITADTHWWGFVIHLNEDATQLLEDIDSLAAKIVAANEELGPVADIIAYFIKARTWIIKAEDRGTGVKLTSPWIMPTLLIPTPDTQHIDDSQLRWMVYSPDNGWSDEHKMIQAFSETSPALAVFNEQLYCVYRGGSGDTNLYWMRFDGSWSEPSQFGGMIAADSPALAVFNGQFYCVYRGGGGDRNLYWTTFNGSFWVAPQQFGGMTTDASPAIAVFNNELYCVFREAANDSNLYWTTFNGSFWVSPQQFGGMNTDVGPAIAVLDDQFYCVFKGPGNDSNLYWAIFDGTYWRAQDTVPIIGVAGGGPTLAVFGGGLYCFYRGIENEMLSWMRLVGAFGGIGSQAWIVYGPIEGIYSAYNPGVISYHDPNSGTQDQFLCVHRGIQT